MKFQDEGARLRKRFQTADTHESSTNDDNDSNKTPAESIATSSNFKGDDAPYVTLAGWGEDFEKNTLPPIGQEGDHWDVIGLDMKASQRRTFLGLLEGKSSVYAKLAESMPEIRNMEFVKDGSFAENVDRFMFTNYGRTSNPFYEHIHAPDLVQKQLVTKFRQSLFPDNGSVPQVFQNHARWLSFLPPLTGTNPLLDAAVRAVTLVHIGRLNNSEPFIMESRPFYGQSLKLLNAALKDRNGGMSNETLCAVILLSFYEMFASDNNDSWIRHAGGVSALMRARGPQRHRHGFDREIFLAYRYTLIIESFQQDVPCFLAEPGWLKLSQQIHEELKESGAARARIEVFDMAEEYYASMVKLPEICAQARALWKARQEGTPPPHSRAQVIDALVQSRAHFKATFARFEEALQKAGAAPTIKINHTDPLLGIEYEFMNTFVSATYTGYWTVMVVLDLCLSGMHADDQDMVKLYQSESEHCALNICRCSAFMLTSSFLGPFFLIFGLRVALLAFEEADKPESNWIMRKLFEIGDRHMGIAKHIPGYRVGITVDELIAEYEARRAKAKRSADLGEKMEFQRQVAHGEIFNANSNDLLERDIYGPREEIGGTKSLREKGTAQPQAWKPVNHVDDVLHTWENLDHYQLQQTMESLNFDSNDEFSRGPTPLPPPNQGREQQFSQATAAFLSPDMDFFNQDFSTEDGLDMGMGNSKFQFEIQSPDTMQSPAKPSPPTRKNTLPRGIERFFN